MPKIKVFKVFIMCILALLIIDCPKVNAECSDEEKDKLIQLASKIEFNYELNGETKASKRLFDVTMTNLVNGLYAEYDGYIYRYNKNSISPGLETLDGEFKDDQSYEVSIYSDSASCKDEFLMKTAFSIPKYNTYSERKECKDLEEFKLCNMWYKGDIPSDKYFKDELAKYKKSLEPKTVEKKEEQKETFLTKIKNVYSKNKSISVISICIAVIITVIIVIITIRNKKKKVKIKF